MENFFRQMKMRRSSQYLAVILAVFMLTGAVSGPVCAACVTEADPTAAETWTGPALEKTDVDPAALEVDIDPAALEVDADSAAMEAGADSALIEAGTDSDPAVPEADPEPALADPEADPGRSFYCCSVHRRQEVFKREAGRTDKRSRGIRQVKDLLYNRLFIRTFGFSQKQSRS